MFDAITFDAVRALRDYLTTKVAEVIAALGAQGIKSVQRGTITGVNWTGTSISITPVNPAKAELRLLGADCGAGASYSARIALANSSQISAWAYGDAGQTISWELTEWK